MTIAATSDTALLRDLAEQYMTVCSTERNASRRELWRTHNSLKPSRPPIYMRAFAWSEMPASACEIQDPFLRSWENWLRNHLFWASLGDDSVFEPWIAMPAAHITPAGGIWGVSPTFHKSGTERGSHVWDAPLKTEEDLSRLIPPHHVINEVATAEHLEQLSEVFGDTIPVVVDRAPAYRTWNGDISTQLAYIRGLEQMMVDMVDRPDWLHKLVTFMRDGIVRTHEQAEEAGDWSYLSHENQAMSYGEELRDPAADNEPVSRKDLWYFAASQETTGVGPAMFDEFMLQYQIPIMEPFGLVAYGCCEDLSHKIDLLRQVPNLRRIAVAPRADVASCVEQIGDDYVVSYRPNPSEMVSNGFDPDYVRTVMRRDLGICRNSTVDITLKDVETVEHDPDRARRWVGIVNEVIDELWG